MSHDYRTQLTTLAQTYAAATGRSEARIATLAADHGAFFVRIRAGGKCTVDMYLKIKGWFADHWPDDLPWPDGVDRPDVLPRQAPLPPRRPRKSQTHEGAAA